jgi:hypothetical protein
MKNLKKLPPRRSNALSKIFREAFYQKMKYKEGGCCIYIENAFYNLHLKDGSIRPWDLYSSQAEFEKIFCPKGNCGYWWDFPVMFAEGSEPYYPDFEARCLALLLAELIAKEGGL